MSKCEVTKNAPTHLGSGTPDALLYPRSRRAISERETAGVHTCRPPHHSCKGLVPCCGAKDGRGVRLGHPGPETALSWVGGGLQGTPNSDYDPQPGGHPGLPHRGVSLRTVPKAEDG